MIYFKERRERPLLPLFYPLLSTVCQLAPQRRPADRVIECYAWRDRARHGGEMLRMFRKFIFMSIVYVSRIFA